MYHLIDENTFFSASMRRGNLHYFPGATNDENTYINNE